MGAILALETSASAGSLALYLAGKCVLERDFRTQRSHNAQLFEPLQEALGCLDDWLAGEGEGAEVGLVVGLGPGSYTGVRIGISALQGLALARGWSLIGLPSVLGLGGNLGGCWLCGDARRGQWFLQRQQWGRVQQAELMERERLQQCVGALEGACFGVVAQDGGDGVELPRGVVGAVARARRLGEAALGLTAQRWRGLEQELVEPVYVRAPFITVRKR